MKHLCPARPRRTAGASQSHERLTPAFAGRNPLSTGHAIILRMHRSKNHRTVKRVALLAAATASFAVTFMGSSVNIALPTIAREFSLDAVTLSWVTISYILAAAMFLIPFGRIADIHGRKRVFQYGMGLYTLSCLLAAIAPSTALLICSRVLQGMGGAMIFGTSVAILTSVFPASERGRALGISVAATYIGLSTGPFLGGLITQHFGWRGVFLATVPLGLTVIVAVLRRLRGEWAEARGEKFDRTGSIVYSLALVSLMYGVSLLPAAWGVTLILLGVTGVLVFIRWETRVKSPALNVSLFRDNPAFLFSNLAALINYSATYAVGFLLSLYLQYIRGFSPEYAGLIMVSQPIVMATFSPIAGRLSDRIEPRLIASGGMALTTAGLVLLTFLNKETGIELVILSLTTLGLGFAFFSSPNTNAVMSSVENKFYGVASGTLGTMRLTGQMFSMGLVMLLLALYIGQAQITPEYYPLFQRTFKTAFTIFAALCAAGIAASLARGRIR